jgi:hypothetical protein
MKLKRVWYYPPITFFPRWWNMLGIPWRGDDEYGRRTFCWGTGLTGYLIWAYRTCQCEDCVDLRLDAELQQQHEELVKKYSKDFADDVLARRLRVREVQKRRA